VTAGKVPALAFKVVTAMYVKVLICSGNDTLLEEIIVAARFPKERPEDAHNLTDVRLAEQIIEYLSIRYNCSKQI
jgi:hypothetical protein